MEDQYCHPYVYARLSTPLSLVKRLPSLSLLGPRVSGSSVFWPGVLAALPGPVGPLASGGPLVGTWRPIARCRSSRMCSSYVWNRSVAPPSDSSLL